MASSAPLKYTLSESEKDDLKSWAGVLPSIDPNPGEPEYYDRYLSFDLRLPSGLQEFLRDFRSREASAAAVVSGFPVDLSTVGATPSHWKYAADSASTALQENFLAMVGLGLGEPFTWGTLQNGRMIHNVMPIQGEESEQSGHGSKDLLAWHTEDAFHEFRCDYLLLFGLRNPDGVPTTVSSVRDVELPEADREILGQPRFRISPDDEHLRQLAATDPENLSLARMQEMRDNPTPVAVLFGELREPYVRIDPYFMDCADASDQVARGALDRLVDQLELAQQDVVIGTGELLVVDNYVAVHGRKSFNARYDGNDRWLKKLLVTRDLRKSRNHRASAAGRVLY